MIELSSQQTQLIVVDLLFLLVALGMLLWFRSWLGIQTRKLDRRFDALDASLKQLNQIQERLQAACRTVTAAGPWRRDTRLSTATAETRDPGPSGIEDIVGSPETQRAAGDGERPGSMAASEARAAGRAIAARVPRAETERAPHDRARQHEMYEQARQLLGRGVTTDEVARMVGLGVAEVEVLKRMGELARSSSR